MEESTLTLSPSKYRLVKLPEIDVKNRPRLKLPINQKPQPLSPLINKSTAKSYEHLKLSFRTTADTVDESAFDDYSRSPHKVESISHQRTNTNNILLPRIPAIHTSVGSVFRMPTDSGSPLFYEPTKRISTNESTPYSPSQNFFASSIIHDLDTMPSKQRKDVEAKKNYFGTFKNMDSLLSKEALVGSPANIFLKECHSMQLLPYSFRMHQESGSLKSIKMRLLIIDISFFLFLYIAD